MNYDPNFVLRLVGLSDLLEKSSNLDESLHELANLTANSLKVRQCLIILLTHEEETSSRTNLKIFAHYGNLPLSTECRITPLNEVIASHVARTKKALLIEDIRRSQFASMVGHSDNDTTQSLMSVPIILSKQIVGVINVSDALNHQSFDHESLQLLEAFALFVGKSLHNSQLQTILRSKFLELAVVRDLVEQEWQETITVHPNPSKLAKIVAKSFFKELTQAGFSANQIIAIATEVLNLLQDHLIRHKKRLERDEI